jgi:hypothetical protein
MTRGVKKKRAKPQPKQGVDLGLPKQVDPTFPRLSVDQQRFVEAFARTADIAEAQADAGLVDRMQAARMLADPAIQAAVQELWRHGALSAGLVDQRQKDVLLCENVSARDLNTAVGLAHRRLSMDATSKALDRLGNSELDAATAEQLFEAARAITPALQSLSAGNASEVVEAEVVEDP